VGDVVMFCRKLWFELMNECYAIGKGFGSMIWLLIAWVILFNAVPQIKGISYVIVIYMLTCSVLFIGQYFYSYKEFSNQYNKS